MKGVGTDIGTIHFVGIGGIGMSGIAEVMKNLGYTVQGSDLAEGASVERLRARGIKVMVGHDAANLGDAAVVVTSTAVRRDNPEVAAALEARIPVVRRAEMLAELMRLKNTVAVAGTHGKTTTTSMVAALLDAGGIDPTVINGGIIESYGSNARLGDSDWMVVEADESDGSFLRLDGTYAIVTNIDPEHLDHYGSFDAVREAFVEFIENVPFYGAAVLCVDHPEVQKVIARVRDRRVVTYGFSAQADWRAEDLRPRDLGSGGGNFGVVALHRGRGDHHRSIAEVRRGVPDQHLDPARPQTLDRSALGQVRALHAVAKVVHDLGNARHADAADADEMDRADVGGRGFHRAVPPANAAPARAVDSLATRMTSWIGAAPKLSIRSARSLAAFGRPQFQAQCAALASVSGCCAMALICLASSLAVKLCWRIERAPPALTISRTLAAWWSSVAIGSGTRIAGRPTAVSSAMVEAPARPMNRCASASRACMSSK